MGTSRRQFLKRSLTLAATPSLLSSEQATAQRHVAGNQQFVYESATDLAKRIRDGDVTCEDVVQAFLDRIR